MASSDQSTGPTWPGLLGSKNWQGLLDPLDLSLRKVILRYGNFCQATYDSFNSDQNSTYCGSSRYGKSSFFNKVMLENSADYKVYAFIYATARVGVPEAYLLRSMSRESWDRVSNWIGYIAVTTDEVSKALGRREIYIAWRGTTRNYEWVDVLDAGLKSSEPLLRTKRVDKAFSGSSSSDSDKNDEKVPKVVNGKLNELLILYKDEHPSVVSVGRGLGATLS